MKNKRTLEKQGITLIALIVTIVLLIILASVAIISVRETNLISKAKSAGLTYKNQQQNEIDYSDKVVGQIDKWTSEDSKSSTTAESTASTSTENSLKIAKQDTSYVGNYADVDGDGNIDGIIFIDFAQNQKETEGDILSSEYEYQKISSDLKEYVISNENQSGIIGERKLLKLKPGTTGTKNRFMIMSLDNVDTNGLNTIFEKAAYLGSDMSLGKMKDYAQTTKSDIGAGRQNTLNLLDRWNKNAYGDKGKHDIWKSQELINKINDGWYLPSINEWKAFDGEFLKAEKVKNPNIKETLKLNNIYWSSTQARETTIYACMYKYNSISSEPLNMNLSVRLIKDF